MTGAYFVYITMTNHNDDTVSFSFPYETNKPDEVDGYTVRNKDVQTKGVTARNVKVTYSNDEEDEI